MAIRKILFETEPTLRKKSKVVTVFDKNLKELFDDMQETLDKAEGAGLSAVQVGILKRMFIIYPSGFEKIASRRHSRHLHAFRPARARG